MVQVKMSKSSADPLSGAERGSQAHYFQVSILVLLPSMSCDRDIIACMLLVLKAKAFTPRLSTYVQTILTAVHIAYPGVKRQKPALSVTQAWYRRYAAPVAILKIIIRRITDTYVTRTCIQTLLIRFAMVIQALLT